jgi:hypothetical protein
MEDEMPLKRTVEKARKDRREGKSPSTQAGEFVREEIDKIRHGEHGARSTKQAIAIGLSEARRAGVKLPPPKRGQVTERTRKSAEYAYEAGQGKRKPRRRPRVSGAVSRALKREPRNTVSHKALSRQAHTAAARRSAAQHSTAQHSTAQHSTALRLRPPGCTHQGSGSPFRGRQEGGADQGAAPRLRKQKADDARQTTDYTPAVLCLCPPSLIHADLRSRSLAPAILRAG